MPDMTLIDKLVVSNINRAVKSGNSFFAALLSTGYSSVRSRSINSPGLTAMTLLP